MTGRRQRHPTVPPEPLDAGMVPTECHPEVGAVPVEAHRYDEGCAVLPQARQHDDVGRSEERVELFGRHRERAVLARISRHGHRARPLITSSANASRPATASRPRFHGIATTRSTPIDSSRSRSSLDGRGRSTVTSKGRDVADASRCAASVESLDSRYARSVTPADIHPSARRAARASARSESPPRMIGGWGELTGFGSKYTASKTKCRP